MTRYFLALLVNILFVSSSVAGEGPAPWNYIDLTGKLCPMSVDADLRGIDVLQTLAPGPCTQPLPAHEGDRFVFGHLFSDELLTPDGMFHVKIRNLRFRAITLLVRFTDGSVFQHELRADDIGENWSLDGSLDISVPSGANAIQAVLLDIRGLDYWRALRGVYLISQEQSKAEVLPMVATIGCVLGVLTAMVLYNITLSLVLRYDFYNWYIAFIACITVFVLFESNMIRVFTTNFDFIAQHHIAMIAMTLATIAALHFFVTFVGKEYIPGVVIYAVIAASSIFLFNRLITLPIESAPIIGTVVLISNVLYGIMIAMAILLSIIAVHRGSHSAVFYLLAWVPLFTTIILRLAAIYGVIEMGTLVMNGMYPAFALEALILSVGIAGKIREQRRIEGAQRLKLESLASTDPLTGLYNRRRITDIAETTLNSITIHQPLTTTVAVLVVDIDHFKRVNDTWGHDVGDVVLKQVAATIKQTCRSGEVVARWGGEEFTVLLPSSDSSNALKVAERIRRNVENIPLSRIKPVSYRITVSIGLSTAIANETTFVEQFKQADEALYQAKESGRNTVRAHIAVA
ncbi:MAG: diguanylate cyclase [Halieaceae bacterium]|nr:diguanylate cyclase [Halieaceae bacterium]